MSEPIRVLHVITRLDRGGSAENTLLTVERMDRTRFVPTLASGPAQGPRSATEEKARQAGVEFVHVPHLVRAIQPRHDFLALRELWRLMRQGGYRIVHTHTSKGGLLGRIAARRARVPVVVHTPHGHVFYGYYGRVLTRIFIGLERWAAGFTDRIVTLTEKGVRDHVEFGIAGEGKFTVIHSGVNFDPFDQETGGREEARAELGIDPGGLVVGTLGRLTAVKAQEDLVAAFARMLPQVGNAWLLLVGDGEERASLEDQARRLGLAGRVVFAGWREDVHRVLKAMDIFGFPSRNEGMGKALVEAMYAGLPAVATAVGGIPELLEDGFQGLLVEPGQPEQLAAALVDLAADAEKRRQCGQAARERASRYSVERMMEKIETLYEELLEEKAIGTAAMV